MKDFGAYLRQHRTSQGITLETISKKTRIQLQHLVALEQGKHGQLPEPTYVRAFLKHYAKYVGLSEEDVLARYEQIAPEQYVAEPISRSEQERSKRRAQQFRARRRRRRWQWMGVAFVLAITCAGWWWGVPSKEPIPGFMPAAIHNADEATGESNEAYTETIQPADEKEAASGDSATDEDSA